MTTQFPGFRTPQEKMRKRLITLNKGFLKNFLIKIYLLLKYSPSYYCRCFTRVSGQLRERKDIRGVVLRSLPLSSSSDPTDRDPSDAGSTDGRWCRVRTLSVLASF